MNDDLIGEVMALVQQYGQQCNAAGYLEGRGSQKAAIDSGSEAYRIAVKIRAMLANIGYEEGGLYERAYATGYRAALGAASAECRRLGEALDNGNNTYVRYPDAIKCAVAISGLRVPSDDGAKRQCKCSDGPYHYSSCPEYTGADPFAALGRAMTK